MPARLVALLSLRHHCKPLVEESDFLPLSTDDAPSVPVFVPGDGKAVVNCVGTSLYVSGTLSSLKGCAVSVPNILVDTGAAITLVDLNLIDRLGVRSDLAPFKHPGGGFSGVCRGGTVRLVWDCSG